MGSQVAIVPLVKEKATDTMPVNRQQQPKYPVPHTAISESRAEYATSIWTAASENALAALLALSLVLGAAVLFLAVVVPRFFLSR